ncbi:MAG: aminotransferase class V-fold PLP-dependent enzyme, partial [Candidatus Brocadiales bacterium]
KTGADVKEVAMGMGLDRRIGRAFLDAGIGYGGSCFPKDVDAFIKICEKLGYDFALLKEVKKINQQQIEFMLRKIKDALWIIKDKTIGILGLSFKPNTDDIRNAPSLEIIKALQAEGHDVTLIPVDREGLLDPEDVKKAVTKKTFLISILLAEGETGAVQPVEEVALLAREKSILFHTDACLAVGKVRLPLEGPGIDLLSISAHKFHGPMGVGALFVRTGTRLKPILFGGPDERGLRPGAVSPALAVGMASALELAEEQRNTGMARIQLLEEQLLAGIKGIYKDVLLNGPARTPAGGGPCRRLPGHLSLCFPGLEAESLLLNLDLAGIAVGAGNSCASGAVEASSSLLAMGLSREAALSSLRFSLSRFNTPDDIAYTVKVLSTVIPHMRMACV